MVRMSALTGLLGPLNSRLSDSPEAVNRALITACAVIWLLVLGMAVASTVALVDLGRGHPPAETGSGTPWLLYVIIVVSALVIASAIPLLRRAQRSALDGTLSAGGPEPARLATSAGVHATSPGAADRDPPGYPGPMPARHSSAVLSAEALDRMWLRCGLGVLTATGAAMLAVALAAYLLAIESNSAASAALTVAALITIAMMAIPVIYLRQLSAALDAA